MTVTAEQSSASKHRVQELGLASDWTPARCRRCHVFESANTGCAGTARSAAESAAEEDIRPATHPAWLCGGLQLVTTP